MVGSHPLSKKLTTINTFSLLKSCTTIKHLKQIHAHILTAGLSPDALPLLPTPLASFSLSNPLDIDYALSLLHPFGPTQKQFIYNTLIRASSKGPFPQQAFSLYTHMLKAGVSPDHLTFPFVVKSCGRICSLKTGEAIHGSVVKFGLEIDSFITSSMITMYANCGSLDRARKFFDEMLKPNLVSSNAIMAAYVKSGELAKARRVFDEMHERDLVSWGTLISGHVHCGESKEALEAFRAMRDDGFRADEVTLASLLSSCSELGALAQGKQFHAYVYKHHIHLDTILGTSLVDMYSKCGGVEIAFRLFCTIPSKDTLAWNAMIMGLAVNGHGETSIGVFLEMERERKRPDEVTFVGVLCACSHAGLLDEGFKQFDRMSSVYSIKRGVEHYGCMVDLLGRAGRLKEAYKLIESMPIEPTPAIWGALLNGCCIHGNLELGEQVGKTLIKLEPHHSGRYVLLSNIYANANQWDDAKRVREMMREKGLQKAPGCSVIEVKGHVHAFVTGEKEHPQMRQIHAILEEVGKRLALAGYAPDASRVLFDLEEEERENSLLYHSEKLAMAFGMISLEPGVPIRVVKNLRVCGDCHSATKMMSKLFGRKIIVRDRSRFHHFEDGSCSCKDYW
ncbi:hypothetical protein AMTRI_Chr09g32190 [Amborella trichopoda]